MPKRRAKGEGSIFQDKHGYWTGAIVMPDGKSKRKRSKTQRVVRDWLLEQRGAVRDNQWVASEKTTLGEFIARYVRDVATHSLRPKTLQNWAGLIRTHIQPGLGSIKLSKLRPEQLQAFYTSKLEAGLSRGYVRCIHSIIHKCLDQAVKWGLVVRNVADLASPPPAKKSTIPNTWSIDELRKFLVAVKDHPRFAIFLMAASMGLREGELIGLHWEDIDWTAGTIHISRSAQVLRGKGVVLAEPKTERGRRTVTMTDLVTDALRKLYNGQSGLIFRTRNNLPINARYLTRLFHSVSQAAGVKVIRFHDLRHTCATLLLSQNVHPKVVQEILGHSKVSLTLDTYSHVIPSMQSDAAQKMNGLLGVH